MCHLPNQNLGQEVIYLFLFIYLLNNLLRHIEKLFVFLEIDEPPLNVPLYPLQPPAWLLETEFSNSQQLYATHHSHSNFTQPKAVRQLIRDLPTSKYGIQHQHQGLQEDGSEVP